MDDCHINYITKLEKKKKPDPTYVDFSKPPGEASNIYYSVSRLTKGVVGRIKQIWL
jgi:hypothetical protein